MITEKLTVIVKPWDIKISVNQGSNLLQTLSAHGFYPESPCGGRGDCGKCTVKIYPAGEAEAITVRSCETVITDNMIVEAPGGSESGCALKEEVVLTDTEYSDPGVELFYPELSLQNWSCLEDLTDQLPPGTSFSKYAAPELLSRMALLAEKDKKITAVVTDGVITDFLPYDTSLQAAGVSVDLGTTTVAGALTDLQTGNTIASTSLQNGQKPCGADVVSRAAYAMESAANLDFLQRCAAETIERVIMNLLEEGGVEKETIREIVITGNPVMQHLLLGISPDSLVRAPFVPVFRRSLMVPAKKLGIGLKDEVYVYILPAVSAYVGGDALTAVMAVGLHRSEKPRLLIDIGTNGEIVLGCRDRLVACSAAAGPAFEGGRLRHGMSGISGAVNSVELKGEEVSYSVIGNRKPAGICGSGVMDAVSLMLKEEVINNRGTFTSASGLSEFLRKRIIKGEEGWEFIIVPEEQTEDGRAISLNRKDIGELQMARGAIRAGIEILLDCMEIQMTDVEEIILAGAFGNYIKPRSASALGLWPQYSTEKVSPAGNAAGTGARILLLSKSARREAEALSRQIEHINLAEAPDFNLKFTSALSFL